MCGIAGIIAQSADLLKPIGRMTRALGHRGPDDEGVLLAGPNRPHRLFKTDETRARPDLPSFSGTHDDQAARVAFGHRRLSIIDLSAAGWQPMLSANGRLAMVFNGEIYNYIELRAELQALGETFKTGSDTEVLLTAFARWGMDALSRLNGMFAFAIYDQRTQRVTCVRDRFGVKPFYYHAAPGLFAFASEIKAFAHHPAIPFEARDEAYVGFLAEGLLDEGTGTFFKDIHSLQGGHAIEYDLATEQLKIVRWYDLPMPSDDHDLSASEFRAMLSSSVGLRLRSDVDVGTCLSGGLDSSAIVALTASLRPPESAGLRHSFSVVYDDAGLSEERFVDAVVSKTGVVSHRLTPTSRDFEEDFVAFMRAQDEPVPSLGMYSQYCVMKLAKRAGIKVLLDGQGADEALAGYHYQFGPFLADTLRTRGPGHAVHEARALHQVTRRPRTFLAALAAYHSFAWPQAVVKMGRRAFRTHASVDPSLLDPRLADVRAAQSQRHQPCSSLRRQRYQDLMVTSIPALLRYEDRSSMAFGIEARLPFLDYRLVEASIRLPPRALVRDGYSKRILRDSMNDLLPAEVCWRKDKLGFPTPEQRFLKESADFVRGLLRSGGDLNGRLRATTVPQLCALDDATLSATPGLTRLLSAGVALRRTRERVIAESGS